MADISATIKSSAGLILTVFIGAINLIGISSGEIPNILRNNELGAILTAVIIMAALMAAVASAMLPAGNKMETALLLPAAGFVLAVGAASVIVTQIPGSMSSSVDLAEIFVTIFIVIGIVSLLVIWRRPQSENRARMSYRNAALFIAVLLTAIAVYSGLRVEAASQGRNVEPRLSPALTHVGSQYSLTVGMSASRLQSNRAVRLRIYAYKKQLPAGFLVSKSLGCSKQARCSVLFAGTYSPDSAGSVKVTVKTSFGRDHFLYIRILGWISSHTASPSPAYASIALTSSS